MRKLKRVIKTHPAITALCCSLLIAGGAFAYYLATGKGTAATSGSKGTPTVNLIATVNQGEIGPGEKSEVTLAAKNTGAATHIGAVTGTVSVDDTHEKAGCLPAWFAFTTTAGNVGLPAEVETPLDNGSLEFINLPKDQGSCKSAVLTVNLTS